MANEEIENRIKGLNHPLKLLCILLILLLSYAVIVY